MRLEKTLRSQAHKEPRLLLGMLTRALRKAPSLRWQCLQPPGPGALPVPPGHPMSLQVPLSQSGCQGLRRTPDWW